MKRLLLIILSFILLIDIVSAQNNKLHMAGIRYGFNLSSLSFDPPKDHGSVLTKQNWSLLYTFYHDLWGTLPYFGLQTGISKLQTGYKLDDNRFVYSAYQIPLVSQFHLDFWKMRLLINIGGYGAYRDKKLEPLEGVFAVNEYRYEFGVIGGGGLAIVLRPFELHIEANYNHSFTYLENPNINDTSRPIYKNPNHLIISASLFIHIRSK